MGRYTGSSPDPVRIRKAIVKGHPEFFWMALYL